MILFFFFKMEEKKLEKEIKKYLTKYYIPKHGKSLANLIMENSLKGIGMGGLMWAFAMPEYMTFGITSIIGLGIGGIVLAFSIQEYYIEKEAEEKGYENMLKKVIKYYSRRYADSNDERYYNIINKGRDLYKKYHTMKSKNYEYFENKNEI